MKSLSGLGIMLCLAFMVGMQAGPAEATDISGLYYLRDDYPRQDFGSLQRDPTRETSHVFCDQWVRFPFTQPGTYEMPYYMTSVYYHVWLDAFPYSSPLCSFDVNWKNASGGGGHVTVDPEDALLTVTDDARRTFYLFQVELQANEWFDGDDIYDFSIGFNMGPPDIPIRPLHLMSFVILNREDDATLQTLDRDGDLLDDYDELFVYYTNPYDIDTDDDGCTDSEEVTADTDPNNYHDHPTEPCDDTASRPLTLYVDDFAHQGDENGTHEHPYHTIQEALDDHTRAWETVIVRDGTYSGVGNYDLDLEGYSLTIRSANGPEACTIDCQQQGQAFILDSSQESGTVLEGLTIVNADVSNADGGAVDLRTGVSATVQDCVIHDNHARYGGGVSAVGATATLVNCEFTGNSAEKGGGAYISGGSGSTLTNCMFSANEATLADAGGGGMYCTGSSPEVVSCGFSDNTADRGGALACAASASPDVTECWFTDNAADEYGGGVYCINSSPELTFCVFNDNSAASNGGAACCNGINASPTLTYCTLVNHASTQNGGALYSLNGASPTLGSSIIAFSTSGRAVSCGAAGSAVLSCCDLYGNAGGDWVGCVAQQYGSKNNNIAEDPEFCDPDNDDFHFEKDSPCHYGSPCGTMGALAAINECVTGPSPGSDWHNNGEVTLQRGPAAPESFGVQTKSDGLTGVRFRLPKETEVTIEVFDLNGRLVRTLMNRVLSSGEQQFTWDGSDDAGLPAGRGVYLYRLRAGDDVATGRWILVK